MEDISNIFTIPLYQAYIPHNEFVKIQQLVLNYINDNKDHFSPVWKCPTLSNIEYPTNNLHNIPLLINNIQKATESYYKEWEFKHEGSIKMSDLWANIAYKGAYQETHKHTNHKTKTIFSGVLYIDVHKDSGEIIFTNPISDLLMFLPESKKFTSEIQISPKNGRILMFPSWLAHYVKSNKSSKPRISISWNIDLI